MLLLTLPAAAQLQAGDLSATLSGVLSLGYDDNWGNTTISNHGLDFGGNGTLAGYYYNPNFVNFNFSPYWNQSQANSESRSIFDTSGFEFSSGIFGGSRFPGEVTYTKSWNSEGNFGIPGVPNYITRGDGQGFSIGWGALLPGLPSLAASFSTGSSNYSIFGTDENGSNDYHNFNVRSGYTLAGFSMSAAYNIGDSHSFIPELFGNQAETVNTDDNSFVFSASHSIPLHGSASVSYGHSYLDTNYLGYTFNGAINNVNAFASVTPTNKLGLSLAMGYTDNLAGSFYQSILATTGTASSVTAAAQEQANQTSTQAQQQTGGILQSSQSSSNALYITGGAGYAVAPNLHLDSQVEHREQTYLGQTYSSNSYGAGATYTHTLLGGFMHASLNFADNTSSTISGSALSFATNGGWNRVFADWTVSVDGGYAQNVESYLISYMNSFYLYSGNVRHKFGRIIWTASAGVSHTAIVNQPHSGSGGESFSTSLGARRLTLSASYSKFNGYGLLSQNGISPISSLPPGVIPPEWLLFYGGNSYSFAMGATPIRHLSLGGSFSRADSNTLSGLVPSANHSEQAFFNAYYLFRKLTFTAGYGRIVQGFSASGVPPSELNSIYCGVSRSFNFF